jgi:hypothetical protein
LLLQKISSQELTNGASGFIDTGRIGFFLGAGASSEFGIPSMKKMTATFAEKLRKKWGEGEQKKVISCYLQIADESIREK